MTTTEQIGIQKEVTMRQITDKEYEDMAGPSPVDIDTAEVGQRVVAPTGEVGTIREIDYDDRMIWVAFPVRDGEDLIDLDPDELFEA